MAKKPDAEGNPKDGKRKPVLGKPDLGKAGLMATDMFAGTGIPRPKMGKLTNFIKVTASRINLQGVEFTIESTDLTRKSGWQLENGELLAVQLGGESYPNPVMLSGEVEEVLTPEQAGGQAYVLKLRFHEMQLSDKRTLVDWIHQYRRGENVTITACKPETIQQQQHAKELKDAPTRPTFTTDRKIKKIGQRPGIWKKDPPEA